MSRHKTIQVDVNAEDALELVLKELGPEAVLDSIDTAVLVKYVSVHTFLAIVGESEVLSHMSTAEIEEEFIRRSPLGRALE
jgi:hypothetical protein